MTLQECTALIAPIALACRTEMDEPTFRAYHRVLKDVPAVLLEAALDDAARSGLPYGLPGAPVLLTACERARRARVAMLPWSACEDCEHSPGLRSVLVGGVKSAERCPCKAKHRARLEAMGLLHEVAELPHEVGAGDEKVYPTFDQLPAEMRQRLQAITERKALR